MGMVEDVSGGYDQGSQWCWWLWLRVSVVGIIKGVSGRVCGLPNQSLRPTGDLSETRPLKENRTIQTNPTWSVLGAGILTKFTVCHFT